VSGPRARCPACFGPVVRWGANEYNDDHGCSPVLPRGSLPSRRSLNERRFSMKYVFGPVPRAVWGDLSASIPFRSRRATGTAVYCQLGRSTPVVGERRDYFPPEDILAEIEEALAKLAPGDVDWITFAGSGEPLLHASIGRLVAASNGSRSCRLRFSPTDLFSIYLKSATPCAAWMRCSRRSMPVRRTCSGASTGRTGRSRSRCTSTDSSRFAKRTAENSGPRSCSSRG